MHRLAFLGLWFAEYVHVLNVFSFVFDSVNFVVDSVADERLSYISTKFMTLASRSVQHRFGQCVFNPPRARRKVSGSIIVTLLVDT